MNIFRLYCRLMKKQVVIVLFCLGFLLIFIQLFTKVSENNKESNITVALQLEENTPVTEGMQQYLSKECEIVLLDNNTEDWKDQLFYQKIQAMIKVPYGFTESMLTENGRKLSIEYLSVV